MARRVGVAAMLHVCGLLLGVVAAGGMVQVGWYRLRGQRIEAIRLRAFVGRVWKLAGLCVAADQRRIRDELTDGRVDGYEPIEVEACE